MKDNQILPPYALSDFPPQGRTNPSRRILFADDDGTILRLKAEFLGDSGYQVDTALDGAIAWRLLTTNKYDLLITDNNMPKVTGVELFKKMHAASIALPVIMATGTLPQEEFARCPWLHLAATLIKPYTNHELLLTVREILRVTAGIQELTMPSSNWQNQPDQLRDDSNRL